MIYVNLCIVTFIFGPLINGGYSLSEETYAHSLCFVVKLFIHSQTSTVAPLKFGNGINNFTPHFIMYVITHPR